jgi:hypothetical protein
MHCCGCVSCATDSRATACIHACVCVSMFVLHACVRIYYIMRLNVIITMMRLRGSTDVHLQLQLQGNFNLAAALSSGAQHTHTHTHTHTHPQATHKLVHVPFIAVAEAWPLLFHTCALKNGELTRMHMYMNTHR